MGEYWFMTLSIDLNADMGEFSDAAGAARETLLFKYITSCNIACGGHAGSVETMQRTLRLAKENNVSCGAHPSYPDRDGFGRQKIAISEESLANSLNTQVSTLKTIAEDIGIQLAHLKPHGALYNEAAEDFSLARLITLIAKSYGLVLVGPPGSALETAALQLAVPFAPEGFIDRRYQMNGALLPRDQSGAVIEDDPSRIQQALALAKGEALKIDRAFLTLSVKTLCIHSDSPGAVATVEKVKAAFLSAGISICSLEQ